MMKKRHEIHRGDVFDVLTRLPDACFEGLLCDPPYGLSFMGSRWDYDVPDVAIWTEALRILKPGAPLLAFGGSRTFHRMAVNVEDAGFELRDTLSWMYGQGFPKSHDVAIALDEAAGASREVVGSKVTGCAYTKKVERGGVESFNTGTKRVDVTRAATPIAKQWTGYGTALKPAWEPIILARKPLEGTIADNVMMHDVGGLNIGGCRIESDEKLVRPAVVRARAESHAEGSVGVSQVEPAGRWPANLILDEEAGALLDAQAGVRTSGKSNGFVGEVTRSVAMGAKRNQIKPGACFGDSGGASRFFYVPKVTRKERQEGCKEINGHPTMKPIGLTTWLAKLILPPTDSAKLLVPYSGVGSEMIGALAAGWSFVMGIENSAEYVKLSKARIRHHVK